MVSSYVLSVFLHVALSPVSLVCSDFPFLIMIILESISQHIIVHAEAYYLSHNR
jgi:hypothetical protein